MMYVIHSGGVPSYRDGTDRIGYLGSTRERLQELGLDTVRPDRNAVDTVIPGLDH